MPSTKPYIKFNIDGVCNACVSGNKKNNMKEGIDWNERKKNLMKSSHGLSRKMHLIMMPWYQSVVEKIQLVKCIVY